MENRTVGIMIIIIAILIGFIIYSFNVAMTNIISTSCSHGPECPMWGSIEFQTNVSLGIMAFVLLIGIYLVLFADKNVPKGSPENGRKNISKDDYKDQMRELNEDEKKVMNLIIEENGTVFQSAIVEKTGFSKAKISRVLDKLEGKKLIERRRRGMTNVIILK